MSRPPSTIAAAATGDVTAAPARRVTVILPIQLCTLAGVDREVQIRVRSEAEPLTQRALLDALEAAYPMLRGTVRDHATRRRRPYLRFFACGEDISHEPPAAPLPAAVAAGREPFLVIGSVAGG